MKLSTFTDLLYTGFFMGCWLLLSAMMWYPHHNVPPHSNISSPSEIMCPVARSNDSLALVALYNASSGPFWKFKWTLSQPVCNWYGVDLDANGYVTEIHLNNNWLNGTLPAAIGSLSKLQYLQLDNNSLSGSIPPEIGNLPSVTTIFLDDNDFSGNLPASFGTLSKLQTLFIDNNQLTGPIPQGFESMMNLTTLDIFNNHFDSLPDMSAVNLQWNRFRIYGNNFTFDDIIPNNGFALNNNYIPQDSFFSKSNVVLTTGSYYEINLGIDKGLNDNVYQWYKNGLPYGAPTNSNTLVFPAIGWGDAGVYNCVVKNARASLLTLYSRPVTISVQCGATQHTIAQSLCEGESLTINGIVYNAANPSGFQNFPGANQYGCDSTLQVNLQFNNVVETTINPTLCAGESITVNGRVYNQSRPNGIEQIIGGSSNGCDSLILIQLSFISLSTNNLNQSLCAGESITVNGTVFDQNNPAGTVTINNGSASGCDSLVVVNLQFNSPGSSSINGSYCEGTSFLVNGNLYDENRLTGTEVIANGASNGCDSTIYIDIIINEHSETFIQQDLCDGGFIIVNGQSYDSNRPNGTEILNGAAANGCDSIVQVQLSFNNAVSTNLTDWLCPNESLVVNGTTYNKNNPTGSELFENGSQMGCDSIVNIQLHFFPNATSNINPLLCPGDFVTVNGNIYNQSNPQSVEILSGASVNGCDSIVLISLVYLPNNEGELETILCNGESLQINGNVYDENNPSGMEVLEGAGMNGCDSMLQIKLSFYPAIVERYTPSLCFGESIEVNGTVYNQNLTSGTEVISNGSVHGCDSVVLVTLAFYLPSTGSLQQILCPGESLILNGQLYDEALPSGVETLAGANTNGCDSTVYIELDFYPAATGSFNRQVCPCSGISYNGSWYDEANPSGTEILVGQAANGCDSTVQVALTYMNHVEENISMLLCEGQQVIVNGNVYNSSNPSGTEMIAGGSVQGCDSIVLISLTFINQVEENINMLLCDGEQLSVNGNMYNAANPSGTEVITGGSAQGCDSVIHVALQFYAQAIGQVQPTLCGGDFIEINGQVYDQQQPSGTEILIGQAASGCDSTVQINLGFYTPAIGLVQQTLCADESIVVNGTSYNAAMPGGTEILNQASVNGCDSTVQVNLNFYPIAEHNIDENLCAGQSIIVNGNIYDENHSSGQELIPAGSQYGCDSLIQIALHFDAPAEAFLEDQLCFGSSLLVNGNLYDANNPSGTEILTNQNVNGCDSTIYINLQFYNEASFQISDTICAGDNYLLNGQAYTQSGSFSQLLTNANGCDSLVELQLMVLSVDLLGTADAGTDQSNCNGAVQLNANLPTGTSGKWLTSPSLSVDDAAAPDAVVSNFSNGNNQLIWSLSTALCTDYDRDTLIIFQEARPIATDDTYILAANQKSFSADLLANDQLFDIDMWDMQLLSRPNIGALATGNGWMDFSINETFEGNLQFSYRLCNIACSNLCDTANVTLKISILPKTLDETPNGITPNDDGVNDFFVFPILEEQPERFPQRELLIFNRWGNIVYSNDLYSNNWGGEGRNGQPLPEGTYYYVLRLDVASGLIYKGDVTILR